MQREMASHKGMRVYRAVVTEDDLRHALFHDNAGFCTECGAEFLLGGHVLKCEHPGEVGFIVPEHHGSEHHGLRPGPREDFDFGFGKPLHEAPEFLLRVGLVDAHFEHARRLRLRVQWDELRSEVRGFQ